MLGAMRGGAASSKIFVRGAASAYADVSLNVTVTLPATIKAGDILVAFFSFPNGIANTTTWNTPSGWSTYLTPDTASRIYTKTAVAADAGASATFGVSTGSVSNGALCQVGVIALANAITPTPTANATSTVSGTATSFTWPTLNTTKQSSLILLCAYSGNNPPTTPTVWPNSVPTGGLIPTLQLSHIGDINGKGGFSMVTDLQPAVGASAAYAQSKSNGNPLTLVTIAFKMR